MCSHVRNKSFVIELLWAQIEVFSVRDDFAVAIRVHNHFRENLRLLSDEKDGHEMRPIK
jgi:hypothetical protein